MMTRKALIQFGRKRRKGLKGDACNVDFKIKNIVNVIFIEERITTAILTTPPAKICQGPAFPILAEILL